MNKIFTNHIKKMLFLGKKILKSHFGLKEETGTVNIKGDRTIGMDIKIEQAFIDYIKQSKIPANIFSEEVGFIKFHSHPTHLIVFDPLDGSTNFKIGNNLLPFGILISCYKGINPKLKDVIASGSMEMTTGLGWIYDGKNTTTLKGEKVVLSKKWQIRESTPVNLDLYYKRAYDAFASLAQKIHIRWPGSNIGSLTYTLAEVSSAMGAYQMRPEEIGTMVSLIKGAGGITVNHKGKDLGKEDFSINKTYKILAGNKDVIQFIMSKLT